MEALNELFKLSSAVYLIIIAAELILSYILNRHYYSTGGIVTNIYLSLMALGLDAVLRVLIVGVLAFFYQFRPGEIHNVYLYWVALLFAEDFMYYLLHVADHYCRLFWAVHVTHHSSEEFNFTVGFRSSVFQPLYRFIYFIPLALCGFKPWDIMLIHSATQIWAILAHTQLVGKLGPLEWFLVTPSNHRVHHASNPQYLDKNMGLVFIIWDRIFGTYEEEKETAKFGLTENIKTSNPVKVVFHEWVNMRRDVKNAPDLKSKLLYIFGQPGWSHDGKRKTSKQYYNEWLQEQKMSSN